TSDTDTSPAVRQQALDDAARANLKVYANARDLEWNLLKLGATGFRTFGEAVKHAFESKGGKQLGAIVELENEYFNSSVIGEESTGQQISFVGSSEILNAWGEGLQGFGEVIGHTEVTFDAGMLAVPAAIDLCCLGSFQDIFGLTDPSGNYEAIVPLQSPGGS